MGLWQKGERLPPKGRGVQKQEKRGGPNTEEIEFGANLCGGTVVLGFWALSRMCFFYGLVVEIDAASYAGRHQHKNMSTYERRKKGRYPEACLEIRSHFMPLVLPVDKVVGEYKKASTNQVASDLSNKW